MSNQYITLKNGDKVTRLSTYSLRSQVDSSFKENYEFSLNSVRFAHDKNYKKL
jgi:hypothetical protein